MNHIRPFSHILSRRQGGALSVLLLGLIVALLSTTTYSQNMGNNLRGRLSPMPRTAQTITTITGEGEVRAELSGNTLTISGTLTLTPELIAALHAESLYVQIHSETNPTGEIRGWLMH